MKQFFIDYAKLRQLINRGYDPQAALRLQEWGQFDGDATQPIIPYEPPAEPGDTEPYEPGDMDDD